MSNTTSTPDEQRIGILVNDLANTRRWTNWTSNLVLIFGLFLLILLCVYFGYFYYTFNEITRPDRVVAAARGYVEEISPDARQMAAEEIQNSAPIWAKEVSSEFIAKLPDIRGQAELVINQMMDEQIEQARTATSTEFERLLMDNREEFGEAFEVLVSEDDSEEFVTIVMPIFEKEFIPGLKYDSIKILGVLEDLKQRFARLAAGKELNPIEKQMRHIMGLTRFIREEQIPGSFDPNEVK